MSGPPPAVAALRCAVRAELADLRPGSLVLVACSGGPDSLALAAAAGFESGRHGWRAGAVVVDHGWRADSGAEAATVAGVCRRLGLKPVLTVAVSSAPTETAARVVRAHALTEAAAGAGADAVLLGHTRDDQAETVLLGLARGSGARSLAGMPRRRGILRRPLLGIERATTARACAEAGLTPLLDPANADRRHARSRVRHDALPALTAALGPSVVAGLARTAEHLRADADLLDALTDVAVADPQVAALSVRALSALPPALRGRVLHRAIRAAGSPPGSITAGHVAEVARLVTDYHGQAGIPLPGARWARRRGDRIELSPLEPAAAGDL